MLRQCLRHAPLHERSLELFSQVIEPGESREPKEAEVKPTPSPAKVSTLSRKNKYWEIKETGSFITMLIKAAEVPSSPTPSTPSQHQKGKVSHKWSYFRLQKNVSKFGHVVISFHVRPDGNGNPFAGLSLFGSNSPEPCWDGAAVPFCWLISCGNASCSLGPQRQAGWRESSKEGPGQPV